MVTSGPDFCKIFSLFPFHRWSVRKWQLTLGKEGKEKCLKLKTHVEGGKDRSRDWEAGRQVLMGLSLIFLKLFFLGVTDISQGGNLQKLWECAQCFVCTR